MDGPHQTGDLGRFLTALLGRTLDPGERDAPHEHDGHGGDGKQAEDLVGGAELLSLESGIQVSDLGTNNNAIYEKDRSTKDIP
jgi:hypothetical protein